MSDSPTGLSRHAAHSEPLIAEILASLGRVSQKFEPENLEMKQWMLDHFHNPAVVELLHNTTFTMLRVLDAVGQLGPVNGITISKQFHIPKGTVSNTTRRLIAQKLMSKETRPNNKKEVLFRLTPLGRELFNAHRAFDQHMERSFAHFLRNYNEAELEFIVRLLHDVAATSFSEPLPEE